MHIKLILFGLFTNNYPRESKNGKRCEKITPNVLGTFCITLRLHPWK